MSPRRHDRSVRSAATAVALMTVLGLVAAGCSKNDTPAVTSPPAVTTSASTSSTTCADLGALRASLTALTQIDPLKDGLNALNAAVATVKTDLATVAASASSDVQPQVAAIKTAFSGLQSALSGVSSGNLAQSAPAIATALIQVGVATAALTATLAQKCPGS